MRVSALRSLTRVVPITLCVLSSAIAGTARAEASSSVVVTVGKAKNAKGHVACGLFAKAEGFPKNMTEGAALELKWVSIAGDTARCEFQGIAPGTYAVAVFHDENDNKKLDTNFLGIPSEAYGSTNNVKHATSAPTFAEAKFEARAGTRSSFNVTLYY